MSYPEQKSLKMVRLDKKLCSNISKDHPKENMSINGKIAFLSWVFHRKYGVGTAGKNCHKSQFRIQNSGFKILKLTSQTRDFDEAHLIFDDRKSQYRTKYHRYGKRVGILRDNG